MREFNYTKHEDMTVLSARFDEFEYKKHSHEEYAIGVTLTGIQQYRLNDELCRSKSGGIMLFHPEQIHDGCSGDKTDLEYVMAYIPRKLFEEVSGKKDVVRFSSPIVYDRKLALDIINLTRSIESGHGDLLTAELIMSVINRAANAEESMRMPRNYTAVRRAVEMMNDNLDTPLKLDEICSEVQLSKFHFIRQFKDIKGLSPYQYFLNRRTEHAKRLLDENDDIYTVMLKCGFYDLSHLNRQFKSVYGLTANAYSHLVRKSR
ncbi:helix-turn-helix domain-containing protein [Maridesulfovibrio sp. FT414]|uniref:helix-turn-helix domain-containing protein n=1 Tax=Maridesulfovibrio sp. FT414 TaxID=2979469 RepID=UPI003D80311B